MNWGNFAVCMSGYPDQPELTRFLMDYPASYHGSAGSLSFADGHAEVHRWRDPRAMPRVEKDELLPADTPSPNNRNILWLQERATRRVQ